MLIVDAQSYISLRSCCKMLHTIRYIMHFSITPCIISKTDNVRFGYIFVNISNHNQENKGPNTVPCGTPLSTGEPALIRPGSLTKGDRKL